MSFLLDDVEYGINILQVHEIIRMPEITRLPNTPDYIRGVINLRGSVIPVVYVRVRFGLPVGTVTDLTRVIVVETGEKLVGLLVDNVYQVVRMPGRNIDPPSDLIEGISDEFINGIGPDRLPIDWEWRLPSGGRIFLSEVLMDDDGTGPWHAAAFSLLMLIGTLGKQYSLPELRGILESAGFTRVEAVRTGGGYYSLVSAVKP